MGWEDLAEYIRTQLDSGHDENSIKNFLISQGYDTEDIGRAMQFALNAQSSNGLSSVRQDLVDYIIKYYKNGYSLDQIKASLLGSGYNQKDIVDAINGAMSLTGAPKPKKIQSTPAIKFELHLSKFTVLILVGLLIVLSAAGFFFFSIDGTDKDMKSTPKQLDVEMTVITSLIEPGNDLLFKVSLTNFGTFRGYDLGIKYIIKGFESGNLIDQIEETKYIESTMSFIKEIAIPDYLDKGKYSIEVIVQYDEITSSAKNSFKIVSSIEDARNETVEINITEPETPETPTNETKIKPQVRPSEDVGIFAGLSRTEIDVQLKSLSKDNPKGAGEGCKGLGNKNAKNICFITLARISGDYAFCSGVDKSSKDSCYITVAMNSTDTDICDLISQKQVVKSCLALIDVNKNKEKLLRGRS